MTSSPADAVGRVLGVLDRMEIPYLAGGSVASSVHGISRPTLDLDIVADLRPDQADEFAALLQPDFYVDVTMIRDALGRGRSFNVIHYQTSFKVDVFPLRDDEYSRSSFARRRFEKCLSFGPEPFECASPICWRDCWRSNQYPSSGASLARTSSSVDGGIRPIFATRRALQSRLFK